MRWRRYGDAGASVIGAARWLPRAHWEEKLPKLRKPPVASRLDPNPPRPSSRGQGCENREADSLMQPGRERAAAKVPRMIRATVADSVIGSILVAVILGGVTMMVLHL